ncbi:FAD-dependent oxidoreductase [Chamaesiphon sp.]|uniref:FAD-dependent oxidoreductase n=1 Tax=Chamaesiphon sp. TaxID=2814140 RepID=UPI003593BD49
MKIAVIGGGASGMVSAYLLDKQGHHVTVFERESMLGGHIRTLNKNVQPNRSDCTEILEGGVLEFPTAFTDFITLMKELDVELEPVSTGSAMFFNNGSSFLSGVTIDNNFTGIHRLVEHLRLDTLYARSAGLWIKTQFANLHDFSDRWHNLSCGESISAYLKYSSTRDIWLKLMVMYSYSIPFELIDDFPAELAMPMLREYIAVNWVRVKGGVYTYIEKILSRFQGEIVLDVKIDRIIRSSDGVKIIRSTGEIQEFDRIVFATPPDQVMALLADPTTAETKRFSAWKANHLTSILHQDATMYDRFGIHKPSEFDFFQTGTRWGYNGYLNQLCDISPPPHYFLSFQLEELIAPAQIIHTQAHHTPLYTTASFRYRDEVVATNGENHTYHAGAYLGDGLHGGAITSAVRVAQLIGVSLASVSLVGSK